MMTTVPNDTFHPLLHLISLGAVAVAIVGVFFGIGFLLLAPPRPAMPPAPPDPLAQAREENEIPPPVSNDTAWGSSSTPPAGKAAASPTPSAPSSRGEPVLEATALEAALVLPGGIMDTKRVRIGRQRHHGMRRNWGVLWRHDSRLWRPDASAGPNPGGGFYGPPNINIGHINPR
jgi:hypothetical protein